MISSANILELGHVGTVKVKHWVFVPLVIFYLYNLTTYPYSWEGSYNLTSNSCEQSFVTE